MMKGKWHDCRLSVIPAALAVLSLPAFAVAEEVKPQLLAQAQEAAAPAPAAAGPASGRIEEVVITARKEEESQQTVPVSVTALSDAALKQAAVTNVFDLAVKVPGLFVALNAQGGAPTFAIRASKADNGTSDTVTAYVDDVPMASTLPISKMTYDMASISVLKGPQGTFFGTSTTGGAIIFRPNKPSDIFEGYAEIGIGNIGLKTVQGMVNVPINDVLLVRFAGEMVKNDGWGKNTRISGSQTVTVPLVQDDYRSARLSVRLKPTTDLMNDLVVNYFHEDALNDRETLAALRKDVYLYPTFLGFSVPVDYPNSGIKIPGDPYTSVRGPHPTWTKTENIDFGNTTTYEINENVSIKNILGYQHARTDASHDNDVSFMANGSNGRMTLNIEQWSEEFSVDTKFWDGRLRNKSGLFYMKREIFKENSYRLFQLPWDTSGLSGGQITALNNFYPLTSNALYNREFESKALYTQFSYDVTDTLTATIGARYTWDEGEYRAENRTSFPGQHGLGNYGNAYIGNCSAGLATYLNSKGPANSGSNLANFGQFDTIDPNACVGYQYIKTSAPSYSFTLENKFSDRQMVYAAFRHGYLIGGFNDQVFVRDQSGQVFLPEEVTDAEFGLKSDWDLFDRPIRTNVALFFAHYKNQQRIQYGVTGQTSYVAVLNAGSTTAYGWDVDIVYDIADWLRLTLGWNHVNAEYDNFKAPISIPGVVGPYVDMQGKAIAQTPENIVSLSGTVKWPLSTDNGDLSSTVSWYWRDDTTARDSPTVNCIWENDPPFSSTNPAGACVTVTQDFTKYDKLDDYAIVNFTTEWKSVMGSNFDLRFWVKNVFDKKYIVYSSNQLQQFGYANYYRSDPRQYGLNVRYNF